MKSGDFYYTIGFAALMSLGMSCVMSFTMTLMNAGVSPVFIEKWILAFLIGFLVGWPTSIAVIPLVRKTLNLFID
jgi:hypothetical protein